MVKTANFLFYLFDFYSIINVDPQYSQRSVCIMRKLFCLLLVLVLLPFSCAGAEDTVDEEPEAGADPAVTEQPAAPEATDTPEPQVTLSPEEWANAKVPYKRMPEPIKIVPYEIGRASCRERVYACV